MRKTYAKKYKGWTFRSIKRYGGKRDFSEIVEAILFNLKRF